MTHLILFLCLLMLSAPLITADYDCYKFGKAEFTTIVECDHGCEYAYKSNGPKSKRLSGGCASVSDVGCRTRGNGITVCTCKGDRCNVQGYEMHDSGSDER
ncbi:hypothetical protein Aduo_004475 [Ancylostoma duodenale]